ncbi:hypothetical protein SCHIN_v1c08960 [Spiroplasma chinense]|uniref:Uncharacterized protein n=1 Tax=Spiroplasma chinense TaxID=216932 RepID=A0A5B9Y4X0_9MOLU|nr:hypothetical protein [Spiroplasma chinense]QEH62091.1 hypothetical protein SCHIN_v1c08960 [Spiroplasma chinense]
MDEKELLKRIEDLEYKVDLYKQKEQYINNGVVKTKEVYEVARHNAEKIITKSVDMAFMIKKDIEEFLKRVDENPQDLEILSKQFLDKNKEIFVFDKEEIKNIAKKIVENVKK